MATCSHVSEMLVWECLSIVNCIILRTLGSIDLVPITCRSTVTADKQTYTAAYTPDRSLLVGGVLSNARGALVQQPRLTQQVLCERY